MSEENNKGGRPSKYKPEYAAQAQDICKWGGFSQAKLAKVFGVGKATITDWRKQHEDFDTAIQTGMDIFNVGVAEKSLLKLVKGFRYKEKKFERTSATDDQGKKTTEMVLVEEKTKQEKPNVRAIENFLRSRAPERWPNVNKIDLSGKLNHSSTTGELAQLLDEIDGTTQGTEHDAPTEEQTLEA